MNIKKELKKLNESDVYSLIMFIMYQNNKLPQYSSMSQLSFILDSKNFLNLCEYFGGTDLHIPKIEEFEQYVVALTVYKKVHFDNILLENAIAQIDESYDIDSIVTIYRTIENSLKEVDFNFD